MKKSITLLILTAALKISVSQTVSPQVVATSGGYATVTNLSVSYTVGEPAVTTVSGGNNILTQGFQQPTDIINGLLDEEIENGGALSLYPVPANSQLWFGYQFNQQGRIEVMLYNTLGQPLNYSLTENYESGKVIRELDCTTFTAGIYFLTATCITSNNTKLTITKQFQIIH
jgi:hypothetical protein